MQVLDKPTETIPTVITKIPPKPVKNYKHDSTWAIKELKDLLEAAQTNKQIISKVQLFREKVYSSQQFYNWQGRYSAVPKIRELTKKIDEVVHANIIHSGQSKNPAFFIFLLKNNYGYQDKREVTTDNNYTFTVNRGLPTAHQQRKLVKATQLKKQ